MVCVVNNVKSDIFLGHTGVVVISSLEIIVQSLLL